MSSIRSVSTKPLKFCFALSFCRLITVISWSSKCCSVGTFSSAATSEKGIMLLSSESSMSGGVGGLEPPCCGLIAFGLDGMSLLSRWASAAFAACTCATRMCGSKNESGFEEDVGCTVVLSSTCFLVVVVVDVEVEGAGVSSGSAVLPRVPVVSEGRSLRCGERLPVVEGLNLRRGNPLGDGGSLSARGMRLIGRPEFEDALGTSGSAAFSASFSVSFSASSSPL